VGVEGITVQRIGMREDSRSSLPKARRLRAKMTDAELRLWTGLRGKQIGGHRFRRQAPMGQYIVDFACLTARLVVEVDGSQHLHGSRREEHRTASLQSRGFRVLRFLDNDVLERTDSVLEAIRVALLEAPTPTLPRERERE
jgi:very-short-patch-repair endonuclease